MWDQYLYKWDLEHEPLDSLVGAHFSHLHTSFKFNFFLPPHTTLFFMDNPFPNRDTVNWKQERKESVKASVSFCGICFVCFCCYADGLAWVVQHENAKFFFNPACPSMQWARPRFMQVAFALNIRYLMYSHLPLRSLVQNGNLKDLSSHCNLPLITKASGMT